MRPDPGPELVEGPVTWDLPRVLSLSKGRCAGVSSAPESALGDLGDGGLESLTCSEAMGSRDLRFRPPARTAVC